ncbi:hypothetical protein CHS0354_000433 [Potamilus streckersoni]|uniref:Transglycosylase SLT domain-containing protein n=1 Tax=Potamilus streckersoni TaxID=2493646 RepID=A0AAE0T6K2_9BIVA|nr:hypothetical protein CHS0354_000433 [Potamilus streckersoni]
MEVVMLTKHHIELIGSKEHFQLKWDSTKRILSLFDAIGDEYENNDTLFDMIKHARDGSIRTTRGEDHYGFPYILLDVPCAISKQRIFLIRVMCWFGNGLYCSLIVKDSRDEMRACMELMKNHIDVLVENELWVSLTDCWAYWDRELITRDNFESALSRVCENGFFWGSGFIVASESDSAKIENNRIGGLRSNTKSYLVEDSDVLIRLVQLVNEDTFEVKRKLEDASDILLRMLESSHQSLDTASIIGIAVKLIKKYHTSIGDVSFINNESNLAKIRDYVSGKLRNHVEDSLHDIVLPKTEIPLYADKHVKKFIKNYVTGERENFQEYLLRAEFRMPREIIYLSIIESGVNPKARSVANARGAWQFMKSTGQLYGLYGNQWFDERCDLGKATQRSMQMLRELYNHFGDWHLALTAYNAGPGKVRRAIRYSRSKDLFRIARYLKRESREYVPRYVAASIIASFPEMFGFKPIRFHKPLETDTLRVDGMIAFDVLEKYTGISKDVLHFMNPEIMTDSTPPAYRHYPLKIPARDKALADAGLAAIPDSLITYCLPYKLKSNATINDVLKKNNLDVKRKSDIMRLNNLSSERLRSGQVLIFRVEKEKYINYQHDLTYLNDSRKERRVRRRWLKSRNVISKPGKTLKLVTLRNEEQKK